MPVERFRSFEDARRALWTKPGERPPLDRMRRLGELGERSRVRVAGGVTRFRTIEEAKASKRPSHRPTGG